MPPARTRPQPLPRERIRERPTAELRIQRAYQSAEFGAGATRQEEQDLAQHVPRVPDVVPDPAGHHLEFDVEPATFDGVLARLRAAGTPYGNDPSAPDNGRIDHPLCARGLYFTDAAGNLFEVMSPA
ncbi:hypothetical protein ACIHEI_26865 [Kitasatospora sp. NPDC051984]|uniref:hypothetical protein n=1 Tax=Kitasatospora sp. NPDC051984 TaxID=3364059 RepID=UPI0037C51F3E